MNFYKKFFCHIFCHILKVEDDGDRIKVSYNKEDAYEKTETLIFMYGNVLPDVVLAASDDIGCIKGYCGKKSVCRVSFKEQDMVE